MHTVWIKGAGEDGASVYERMVQGCRKDGERVQEMMMQQCSREWCTCAGDVDARVQ